MIVSDTAIKNRISVVVLAFIILTFGTYSYFSLPRESEPDITIPFVFISTSYKGVSSTDIETSITKPIEKKIKGLEGIKKVSSVSTEGLSQINIEFTTDTDIDDVLRKVKDKVDEARNELPHDLENDPNVFEVNFSEMPIVTFSLSGTCGLSCLKKIADKFEEDIESIPGVLEVEVIGGLEREIRIEVDPDKLAYYRIPITTFQQVVSNENQNTSGGSITLGDGRYQLRIPGEFETPDEIYNLVVGAFSGRPVYLKDVAKIVDGYKDETGRSRLDGKSSVNISVKKRVGENIIAITDQIDELIARVQPTWPQGTEITKLMDKAKEIRNMVADLENNILSGLVLVIVVLLFALGIRNATLVASAIPFSMLLSFTILDLLGLTLNMVVLFSLTLALGMLVDNAIVIVENIYRYMEQGVPRVRAAMRATSEVAYPVIGSTITTLAAFFPMIFWPGIMGEFMKYLPITLIVTLSSSLFVALVINPALGAFFIKVKSQKRPAIDAIDEEAVADAGEKPIPINGPILRLYSKILQSALNYRITVLMISFLILVILFQLWMLRVGIKNPTEFFPHLDPASAFVNIDPPEGADLEYLDRIVKKVEMAISSDYPQPDGNPLSVKGYEASYKPKKHTKQDGSEFYGPSAFETIEHLYAKTVQSSGGANIFDKRTPNHIGIQFIDLADRPTPSSQALEVIRKRIKHIPGALLTVEEEQGGPPTGAPINIEISGTDMDVLGKTAQKIKSAIEKLPYLEDIQDDFVAGLPSIQIKIDRQKAAMFGLSTNAIGFVLKTAYNGLDVSTYREADEDYDITVKLSKDLREQADLLYKLMIPTATGGLVPLTSLATITYTGGMGDIVRINYERVVTIKANVDETNMTSSGARTEAEKLLKNIKLPVGYHVKFTGENEHQKESEAFLEKTFVIAVFLIFFIMVTLFNSVTQPAIIMTSVILSLGGAFLGLAMIRSPFGIIMSGVGVISLAGVVVNNAIVLIDYTNKLRERGLKINEAVLAAGATRLRPVLLTAITTILGLIPMVTGISWDFHTMSIATGSESTQWWKTMAIVVIYGLFVATFLTLIVVPTLYSLLFSVNNVLSKATQKIKSIYWKPINYLYERQKLPYSD